MSNSKYPKDFINIYQRKMALYPNMYGEAGTGRSEFHEVTGAHHDLVIQTYENGYARWYLSVSQWKQMAQSIAKKLFDSSLKPNDCRKKVELYGQKALALLSQAIPRLANMDRKQIRGLIEKANRLQRKIAGWGDPISFTSEQATIPKLNELLQQSIKNPTTRKEVLAKLLTLDEPSFSTKEECELLEVAQKGNEIDLQKHAEKWAHIAFDYTGPVTTVDEFRKRMSELKNKDIQKQLDWCRNYPIKVRREKETLIKKYRITTEAQKVARIIAECNFVYDLRKSYLTKITYELAKVLDRVSQIVDLPREWLNWLFAEEVSAMLDDKMTITATEIKSRQKNGVIVYEGGHARFLSEKEKPKYLALLQKEQESNNAKELQGQAGSPGIVTANVNRIMSASHNNKMKRGDVLVAPMTTVDFLPAMRMASAIVTDIGGITSHAAIVARELKIPAVVGTKFATKALKDGQKIEVDGTKGIVRRLP